jgi:hypothetical protein
MTELTIARRIEYVTRNLEGLIRDGEKANASMAKRLADQGLASVLEWASSYLEDEETGRLAKEVLDRLNDGTTPEALSAWCEKSARKQTDWVVLSNNQCLIMGQLAKVKAFQKIGVILSFAHAVPTE